MKLLIMLLLYMTNFLKQQWNVPMEKYFNNKFKLEINL